jgi:hypothetical protein
MYNAEETMTTEVNPGKNSNIVEGMLFYTINRTKLDRLTYFQFDGSADGSAS